MNKRFYPSQKSIIKFYNRLILKLNILPISILIILTFLIVINSTTFNPIKYYYFLFIISTCVLAYSFTTVLIFSVISTISRRKHSEYSYVEITCETLIVSRYVQTYIFSKKPIIYKKLYLIKLNDITDIYFCKKNLVITGPCRYFFERADWLSYKTDSGYISFDKWWYDKNGSKLVNGVQINNMYASSMRIARTISNSSGKAKEHFEARNSFHQKMLSIAQQTAYQHRNLLK